VVQSPPRGGARRVYAAPSTNRSGAQRDHLDRDRLGNSDTQEFAERKETGTRLVLTAVRRSGKSGVMPRTARVAPGGFVYHVLNRSVGRMHMFRKDADFEAFKRVMVERKRSRPCYRPGQWSSQRTGRLASIRL
jgi:hypothetical protein